MPGRGAPEGVADLLGALTYTSPMTAARTIGTGLALAGLVSALGCAEEFEGTNPVDPDRRVPLGGCQAKIGGRE